MIWAKRFPQDTVIQFNYLPTLHAQLALSRSDPSKAIEALQAITPYDGIERTVAYLTQLARPASRQRRTRAADQDRHQREPEISRANRERVTS